MSGHIWLHRCRRRIGAEREMHPPGTVVQLSENDSVRGTRVLRMQVVMTVDDQFGKGEKSGGTTKR